MTTSGFYGAAEPRRGNRLSRPLPPPDLVIQDELHLISGPLGTMAGLYEAAIEALCVREIGGRQVKPKIVASTATVRHAREQIQGLFGRPATYIFPPPGPARGDSFFARTMPVSQRNAREYVGIASQGRNPKEAMRRVVLTLMGAAERAWRDAGGPRNPDNPADPYMTVLGYFNSLRELGGARRILEEEVQNTLKRYSDRKRLGEAQGLFRDRSSFSDVVELTSRVSTDRVAEARRRLQTTFHDRKHRVDCAIATNMISVGLDIQRLGLMLVYGQPKTNAEYIQATSRVGRDDRRPGLVVTLYNVHRPRDRSHYERFRHYHETFYRSVEVASVTPFAARALDRGFAGALVTFARHTLPSMTPPAGVEAIEAERAALERLLLKVFRARINEQPLQNTRRTRRADAQHPEPHRRPARLLACDPRRLPRGWRTDAVSEIRSPGREAAPPGDAGYRLRVGPPQEIPRQPVAARCRAAGEPVPERPLQPAQRERLMNGKAHGQLRRSQVITTFGPGALIDLPNDSAIVGGLDTWGAETSLEPIEEPRLSAKLTSMTGVPDPRLYAPPPEPDHWQDRQRGIGAWRFPEWFVVQESNPTARGRPNSRSRRMVHRTALDRGRFDRKPVVATRFVRACSRGHVDDIDWRRFVHKTNDECRRQLWLDERGTSGDLAEQIVRCECGKSRRMHEAADRAKFPTRHLQRRPTLARPPRQGVVRPAESAVDPYSVERLVSAGAQRALPAGPRHRGGSGSRRPLAAPANRHRCGGARRREALPRRGGPPGAVLGRRSAQRDSFPKLRARSG